MSAQTRARSLGGLTAAPQVPLEEALKRARRLVSERTGLVACVELLEAAPTDPALPWARSVTASSALSLGARALDEGNAAALTADHAIMKAVGESIERYSAAWIDPDRLVMAAARDLPGALPPERFALFTEAQYAGFDAHISPKTPARFTAETEVRWVGGWSLTADRPVEVPASFVFIPYALAPGEARIAASQISTGLAAHTGRCRAALKALLEVIERDAFMLCWHRGIRCPALDPASVTDPHCRALLDHCERLNHTLHLRVLTLDIPVTIILATLVSDGDHRPLTVVGASAEIHPENALRLALEEALLSLHGIGRLAEAAPDTPPAPDYADIDDLLRHARAFAVRPELAQGLVDWLEPSGTVALADLPRGPEGDEAAQLAWLVDMLAERELEAVVVDLTPPDVFEAGFVAMRALIPDAQPLDVSHDKRHLGGSRLWTVPEALGLVGTRCVEGWLNPLPHPFP